MAHNAAFDLGFLSRAARHHALPWPKTTVVDTLALARLALPRPLVSNHKLATLAAYMSSPVAPGHRALEDAKATAAVLAGLLDAMAPLGVTTVPDITVLGEPVPHSRRRRSSMADGLPASPGVYRFLDEDANPLYIGSATSLESRVRSYFTGAEKRRKIQRMVDLAAQVEYSICSTVLEARVLELRQIRYLRPIFNSASTRQDSQHWLTLDSQRLEVVSRLPQSALGKALGPFGTRHHDETARNGILMACMPSTFGVHTNAALVLSDSQFEWVSAVLQGQHCGVVDELESAMSVASRAGNYEGAARIRERLSAYSTGIQRQDLTVNLMGPQK